MRLGYARVSTQDQNLSLQLDALHQSGCEKIYQEKITGTTRQRPQLQKLLEQLRPNDVIVVWKLDRLARSLKDLVELVNLIQEKGAALQSLHDQIDTTTPHGNFTFHVFAALAEFERDIIRDRTLAGLSAARARGRTGGRPKGLSKKAQNTASLAKKLYEEKEQSIQEICEQLSISRRTLYKYLRHQGAQIGGRKPPQNKVLKVSLFLRVEGNNSYIRGKKKVRENIEQFILQTYNMEKPDKDRSEYILYIPYETDEELENIIYQDILQEASFMADMHNCFIEADVRALDGSDRHW